MLPLRALWFFKLVVLLERLLAFTLSLSLEDLAGVAGGDTKAAVGGGRGSDRWPFLRSRAAISSMLRFTLPLPSLLALDIRSKAE